MCEIEVKKVQPTYSFRLCNRAHAERKINMSGFYDWVDHYMPTLCDCESYHICEWHKRLKSGEKRSDLVEEMRMAYLEVCYEDYERANCLDAE